MNASYLPLTDVRESISSKNKTHGAAERAFLNNSETAFSDSPTYLLNNWGPWIYEKKNVYIISLNKLTCTVASPPHPKKR